jgi:hypothetical protein
MRMTKLTIAVLTAFAGFAMADGASAQTMIGWGDNATSYRGQNGNRLSFVCPGGGSANTVWGTDIYTDDSSICTAAVHAGAIGWGGGVVTLTIMPGMQSYGGSNRNGVSTQNYPAWTGSYSFGGAAPAADWSQNAQSYIGRAGPVTMNCPPNGSPGAVWGTDYYTTDSSVCTAALHAGVINRGRGGTVTFYMSAGLGGYPGSSRNGVTTSSWGSYTSTFAFTPNAPAAGRGISWANDGASVVSTGQSAVVMCPGGGSAGSVWGTDVYSSDSSICTAAVHAGVIGWGGGAVQITGVPGQGGYAASSRNGVSTSSWGSYHSSFIVARPR